MLLRTYSHTILQDVSASGILAAESHSHKDSLPGFRICHLFIEAVHLCSAVWAFGCRCHAIAFFKTGLFVFFGGKEGKQKKECLQIRTLGYMLISGFIPAL